MEAAIIRAACLISEARVAVYEAESAKRFSRFEVSIQKS
jgi:hypothetical protein